MKMKSLLIAVVCAAMSFNSFAQDLDFGIKVGANYANLSSNIDVKDYNSTPGLHAGVFLSISATDKFELQPEILYSLQGTDIKTPLFATLEDRYTYVNIPILAKIFIVQKLNIQVGPQFGVLVSAKSTSEGIETDIKDQLKSSSFDGVIGLGYDLLDKLDLSVRYTIGLSDIDDSPEVIGFAKQELKNNVLQFSVGYAF